MFDTILIANRGEIACRIAATCRRLGIRSVAVYSEADATARHVEACDKAMPIGGAAAADSYLQIERIVKAAQRTGAQAIHPGYGFLSENEAFANACVAAGLEFIGPPVAAIAAMGSKARAKALMQRAAVPLVPGYHGEDQSLAVLQREADAIGYPVLLKASAGGGGKGMRVVERSADFAAALSSCQREAQSSFGDSQVLIEKYLIRPRHIEVQVFADKAGETLYLFDRDCSVQRRHQKVLEEAPAPGLPDAVRRAMGEAAVAAACAVSYVGAGTVEFIMSEGRFYFMEMNTRLQVEHPVTEMITGLDLVEWQLRVAAGEALPCRQSQIAAYGHAIEARLYAEHPARGFLPSTGQLKWLSLPDGVAFRVGASEASAGDAGPPATTNAGGEATANEAANEAAEGATNGTTKGTTRAAGTAANPVITQAATQPVTRAPVRIDSGVRSGDTITPFYDPMIAKLIVWGPSRDDALRRMRAALRQVEVVGPHTNAAFLQRLVASEPFAAADLDTGLIERHRDTLFAPVPASQGSMLALACAALLRRESRGGSSEGPGNAPGGMSGSGAARREAANLARTNPWQALPYWRLNVPMRRVLSWRSFDDTSPDSDPQGTSIEVILQSHDGAMTLELGGRGAPFSWRVLSDSDDLASPGQSRPPRLDVLWGPWRSTGRVVDDKDTFHVFEGGQAGRFEWQNLLAHAADEQGAEGRLTAPMPGKVVAVLVEIGAKVEAGAPLMVLEAMKMEHTITAPAAGVIEQILFAVGDQVAEGAQLLALQA